MSTLAFDGVNDYVQGVSPGALNGAFTVAVVSQIGSLSLTNKTLVATKASSSGFQFKMDSQNRLGVWNDNVGNNTLPSSVTFEIFDATDWFIWIVGRGSGETPRFHQKNITDATAMVHGDGETVQTTNPDSASGGAIELGRFDIPGTGTFDFHNGSIALVGWWDGIEMSDAQAAELGAGLKTSEWYYSSAGSPSSLTELRSASPTDLMGLVTWTNNGATLTGADPPGWTFDGALWPPPGTDDARQKLRVVQSNLRLA